jgi:hypothetical protein
MYVFHSHLLLMCECYANFNVNWNVIIYFILCVTLHYDEYVITYFDYVIYYFNDHGALNFLNFYVYVHFLNAIYVSVNVVDYAHEFHGLYHQLIQHSLYIDLSAHHRSNLHYCDGFIRLRTFVILMLYFAYILNILSTYIYQSYMCHINILY